MDTLATKKYAENSEQAPRSIPPLLAGSLQPGLLQGGSFSDLSSVVREVSFRTVTHSAQITGLKVVLSCLSLPA